MARDFVAIILDDIEHSTRDAGGNPDALDPRLRFCILAAHPERE